jgi:hypothetical protein
MGAVCAPPRYVSRPTYFSSDVSSNKFDTLASTVEAVHRHDTMRLLGDQYPEHECRAVIVLTPAYDPVS